MRINNSAFPYFTVPDQKGTRFAISTVWRANGSQHTGSNTIRFYNYISLSISDADHGVGTDHRYF